jgi:RNase H
MKKVSLITDGSCLGNPGPGGWACVLRFGGVKKELFGFDPLTTNNRMELMAPIQGLLALKEPCEVEITTDAEYVFHGITKWPARWKWWHWWRKARAGAQFRSLDGTRRTGVAAPDNLGMNKGPQRPRGQQPLRLPGANRGGHAAELLGGWSAARSFKAGSGRGLCAAETASRAVRGT